MRNLHYLVTYLVMPCALALLPGLNNIGYNKIHDRRDGPPGDPSADEPQGAHHRSLYVCHERYYKGHPVRNQRLSSPCMYFQCVGRNFFKLKCPNGLETIGTLDVSWNNGRKGSMGNPCMKHSEICKDRIGIPRQKIEICGIDLVWAIDISCSISDENKVKVRRFVQKSVSNIPMRGTTYSQVGALAFSEKIYHVAYLNEFKRQSKVLKAIREMKLTPHKCGTVTYKALEVARTEYFQFGRRPKRKSVFILTSDGFTYPKEMKPETMKQAQLLKATGVDAYVVGLPNILSTKFNFSEMAGMDEWRAIASRPENIFTLKSFDDLTGIIKHILRSACLSIGSAKDDE